jgi:hypothetical protein
MRPLKKDGPSTGMFRWTFGLKERVWSRYDFGDTLPMSKTRAHRMNLPEGTPETHKCFFLCLGGLMHWRKHKKVPYIEQAQIAAQLLLEAFDLLADPLQDILGGPPEVMTQAEADLRVFHHDLVWPDHDTDYRLPAALPIEQFKTLRLCFVRVDSQHCASLDTVTGEYFTGAITDNEWLHAKAGHLTLMIAEDPIEPPHFARDIPAIGWEAHLEAAMDSPRQVSMPDCPHCNLDFKRSDFRTGKVRSHEMTSYECGAYTWRPQPRAASAPRDTAGRA